MPNTFHSYWMFSILVNDISKRDTLREYLNSKGIETRPIFYPVHTMPMYSNNYQKFPVAENIGWRGINLPSFPDLKNEDINYIISCIKDFFSSYYKFIDINLDNIELLKSFLNQSINNQNKFRYYKNRNIETIKNHLCTYLLIENNNTIGYGHLDKEDEKIWLGIALTDSAIGKGYGKIIMEKLIQKATESRLNSVFLSVDSDNFNAIKLYEKFGFVLERKDLNTIYYKRIF